MTVGFANRKIRERTCTVLQSFTMVQPSPWLHPTAAGVAGSYLAARCSTWCGYLAVNYSAQREIGFAIVSL